MRSRDCFPSLLLLWEEKMRSEPLPDCPNFAEKAPIKSLQSSNRTPSLLAFVESTWGVLTSSFWLHYTRHKFGEPFPLTSLCMKDLWKLDRQWKNVGWNRLKQLNEKHSELNTTSQVNEGQLVDLKSSRFFPMYMFVYLETLRTINLTNRRGRKACASSSSSSHTTTVPVYKKHGTLFRRYWISCCCLRQANISSYLVLLHSP